MADKIGGYGRNGVDLASTKTRGPDRNERAAEGDKAPRPSSRRRVDRRPVTCS